MLNNINKEIELSSNKEKAQTLQRFFKTKKGEYGEGDIFLGLTIPQCRNIAKKYNFDLNEILELLKSKEHEKRMIALMILLEKYKKSTNQKEIIDFYLDNTKYINNWDLVDITCYKLIGDYVYTTHNYDILLRLSKSTNLWEKRISIVSSIIFARKGEHKIVFKIINPLLKNQHDLINKANGWILRELGKKNMVAMKQFLVDNINNCSNTTLSYAMEKFSIAEKLEIRELKRITNL